MKLVQQCFKLLVLLLTLSSVVLATDLPKKAESKPSARIKVILFEQPCWLSGPFDVSILTAIHAISPEKIPPNLSIERQKKLLEALKKTLPPALEIYRDRLRRRLNSEVSFSDSMAAAKPKANVDLFLNNVRENVLESQLNDFEISARKLALKAGTTWNTLFVDQLKQLYENVIEPSPEEEFHRAIQKADIHYDCAFDESE